MTTSWNRCDVTRSGLGRGEDLPLWQREVRFAADRRAGAGTGFSKVCDEDTHEGIIHT